MSDPRPLLEVTGLTKRFGGLTVASNVGFTLDDGDIHCIIGPNGAGKTTFFNMLTGFIQPDGGTIEFAGTALNGLGPDYRARLGIARSFQRPQFFPLLTVRENVHLAARRRLETLNPLARVTKIREVEETIHRSLEQVELLDRRATIAGDLSHGEQKRLDVAMALATRPRLLLLDEPTAGMTIRETAEMARLIQALAPDITVLVIEHDMAFVRGIARRVTVFHRGEILAAGAVADIEANPEVQKVYLGSSHEG